MKYEWLEEFCCAMDGVVRDYKEEWDAYRYLVGGKMFVMHGGDKEGKPMITVKLEPANGELMRGQYPKAVVPGYYMNKTHWNSVYVDGDVPDQELKKMLKESYKLVFGSLTKKAQAEIQGTEK